MKKIYPILFGILMMMFAADLSAQTEIKGTITDDNKEPLIGATILIVGTSTGTITEIDGSYSILTDLTGDQNLEISFTGYTPQIVPVSIAGSTVVMDFVLAESSTTLDEVVVTGTFSSRTQKDSPISMTLLNAKELSKLASNSQADILRTVPGITAEGGGGEVASNVFIRGMPSGGQYQFTPLQVDGLPVLSTFGLNSSAHDVYFRNDLGIRNLEFVRGGASTLFGAGSVAGIINYSSVTGSAVQKNAVQLEWAEGGRAKADFLVSGPLSEDMFYAVSGFYRYDEGPLETGLATKGTQIRANVKKLFNNGNGSLTISSQYIDDQVQFYLPYPLQNDNGEFSRPTGNDGEEVFTLLTGAATDFSFDTPNGRFETPIGDGVITKGGYLMMDLKQNFGNNWKLSAKAKYADYDHQFNLFLDGDGTHNVPEVQADYLVDRDLPSDAVFTYVDSGERLATGDLLFENRVLDRDRPMEELVGEFNLTKLIDAGSTTHNFTVGTFLSHTEAHDDNWIWNYVGDFSNSPRMVEINYVDTDGNDVAYSTGGFIRGAQTSNRYHTTSKYAFYLADEIKGERFSFDIGLRYEKAIADISRETGVGSNTFQKGRVSDSDFAVAIAGLYKLNTSTNLYANFSKGYFFPQVRSVAFINPGQTQSYETEQILQGEIGVKYASNTLSATAALFYVSLNDRRNIDFVNDGQGGVIEDVSLQDTRTIGIETNVNYGITKDLNAYGSLTFQAHEFTSVENNPELEGNWLRRQPRVMGMLGLSYDNDSFDANVSANMLGKKYANDANTVELDAHSIVRLDAGYSFGLGEKNQKLRIGVSVFNLLDSEGVTEGSPRQGNSQIGGGDFFVGRPILPRRIFVRARFDF